MDDQGINRGGGGELFSVEFDDDDVETIDRFRNVLRDMGAKFISEEPWTPFGDIYENAIGDETLSVVSDGWTGTVRAVASAELVARIQDAMKEKQNPTT